MTSHGNKENNPGLNKSSHFHIYFLVIVLPFILLYWTAPFVSDATIGNDYTLYSINEQIEILFSVKTGSFPLYVPGYAQGHSAAALTLSQLYHPLSHLASLIPGYWSGKALEWNTLLRFLILGLTQLVLFSFLRKLRLNILFSFVLSLVTVYNLRMLEAFRYGASLEAFTGHLLLCAMIGRYFISPSKYFGPLSIIGLTYLLICSGHPPMMFYGLVGAGFFTIIAPFFLSAMLSGKSVKIKEAVPFWGKVGAFIGLGVLLAAIYVMPLYFELVQTNSEYAHAGWHSDMGQDTFMGVLNNFFMPQIADLLSSFGGSSLMLLALLLPLLRLFKVKIPPPVWVIWGMLMYILFYILGAQTPVFKLAYDYFPFVSSAGGVGRISLIAPFLIMLLLAWLINAGPLSLNMRGRSFTLSPYALLGYIALVLIPLYLLLVFLAKPQLGFFTPHLSQSIPLWIELVSVLLGMFSIAALISYDMYPSQARLLGVILCLMIALQIGTILKYGVWIEEKKDKPTFTELQAQKKKNQDFNFHQMPEIHHNVVIDHLSRSFLEPFLGKIFTQIIPVSSQDEAYIQINKERLPQQMYVEGYDKGRAEEITEYSKYMNEGKVELVYNTFNHVQFRVTSQAPALFGLSYPYTGHWRSWIDGKRVPVYRGNGAAHAVEIPEGESLIEFRYWSNAFFWGVTISCMTFIFVGVYVCSRAFEGYVRILGIVCVIAIGTGGFILWYSSLYSGDNLNTEYTWHYTSPQIPTNIAYGKKTSGFTPGSAYLQFHSSNAVDGETSPGSGFPLKTNESRFNIEPGGNSSLIVDLNKNETIKTILIYGKVESQPLIFLSQDGNQWYIIMNVERNHRNPLRIDLKETKLARFVRIKPSKSELEIDEVEIYREQGAK